MNRSGVEIKPINQQVKRQTLVALGIGMFMACTLVFTVVWSGTKQHMEEKRLKELEKKESVENTELK